MRKLPYTNQLSKHQLQQQSGITEAARSDLQRYLAYYGFEIDAYSKRIRDFFLESQDHSRRLAYRDTIARHLDLDVRDAEGADAFWGEIAALYNFHRGKAAAWKVGLEDMPLGELRALTLNLLMSHPSLTMPDADDLLPVLRSAIARTVTYIRVHPPESAKGRGDLPDGDSFPEQLEPCWRHLRRHPHYRNSKPPTLNQHALDSIEGRYDGALRIGPHQIGQLRAAVESLPLDPATSFWFWPFVIFKYATRCNIRSTHHRVNNFCADLWNADLPGHSALWGS